MFSKVLIPMDTAELELSAGILPYVSRLSKDLGVPAGLMSVLDPNGAYGRKMDKISGRVAEKAS